MGGSFDQDEAAHETYRAALETLKRAIPDGQRVHWIDRSFLPTYTFGPGDLVLTLGPDGLVVNTAKYLDAQLLLAFNPDPSRIDGVLVPFDVAEAEDALSRTLAGSMRLTPVTMAEAVLNDGQRILAVNDLFIGRQTHVSARYRLRFYGKEEDQSSSGIIVSTGAGSTGWFRSVLTGATGLMQAYADSQAVREARDKYRFPWDAQGLVFSVREPFISRTSGAEMVFGRIMRRTPLEVISQMPQGGVIFSDGVEEDRLAFNSGAIARIGLAARRLNLVVPPQFQQSPPGD
jgi:hypothetical protein